MDALKEELHNELTTTKEINWERLQDTLDTKVEEITLLQSHKALSKDVPFMLRAKHPLQPKATFEFNVNDLLSTDHKDWMFYEFMSVYSDFDEYEGVDDTDRNILFSKHRVFGVTPKTPGHYYYMVDMKYMAMNGDELSRFETTLELVVEG